MQLDGIHHITAITADAAANVAFYTQVLGLKMVKKTINHDMPEVYHLYYADARGTPGSVLTFFEFPDAEPGQIGAGAVHTIVMRVQSTAALEFWSQRLSSLGYSPDQSNEGLRFKDPEGLGLLIQVEPKAAHLSASHHDVPPEFTLGGFSGVRVYANDVTQAQPLLAALGFEADHKALFQIDKSSKQALQGAGSVHHVAWACESSQHQLWRARAIEAGANVTPVIDRMYFKSIYFREPGGVLFEIATKGPGFDYDEPADRLGESLVLPARYEHMRKQLEKTLTPL